MSICLAAETKKCVTKDCPNDNQKTSGTTWVRNDITYFKCTECNRTARNLNLSLQGVSEETHDMWSKLAPAAKADFKLRMAGVGIEGIAAAMTTELQETNTVTDEKTFEAQGEMMDEETLDEAYKNRPLQLAAIKRNARKLWCPIQETNLYEVPKYRTASTHAEKGHHEAKRKLEAQEQVKAAKRLKTAPALEAAASEPTEKEKRVPISEALTKKLDKIMKSMHDEQKKASDVAESLKADEDKMNFVPLKLREGLAQNMAAVEEQIANIALVKAANCAKDAKNALAIGKSSLEALTKSLSGIRTITDIYVNER